MSGTPFRAQNKGMHTWHQPIKSKGSERFRQTGRGKKADYGEK